MNIFLTGSNGYIGNAFLLKAAKKGNKVFAVTRKKKNRKIKNVKWLIGPINKKWSELKKTDILVVGLNPGSKFSQAKELLIDIVNEESFLSYFNEQQL